jgi:hypothetical protein
MRLFRFIIEDAALIFLPFVVLRKKPEIKQIFFAGGLIILQVILRQLTQLILYILFSYSELITSIVSVVLVVITEFVLIYGAYFVLTKKFTKPDKPLFIAMAVYISVTLIGTIFSTIAARISYLNYSMSEPSIMQIMEMITHQSAGIYSQLSDFFNGKFVLCLIQTVFIFFLVKYVQKRENTHDPVPE